MWSGFYMARRILCRLGFDYRGNWDLCKIVYLRNFRADLNWNFWKNIFAFWLEVFLIFDRFVFAFCLKLCLQSWCLFLRLRATFVGSWQPLWIIKNKKYFFVRQIKNDAFKWRQLFGIFGYFFRNKWSIAPFSFVNPLTSLSCFNFPGFRFIKEKLISFFFKCELEPEVFKLSRCFWINSVKFRSFIVFFKYSGNRGRRDFESRSRFSWLILFELKLVFTL